MIKTSVAAVLLAAFVHQSHARLAITEVMSSSQNTPHPQHSDFWELTNFGTNSVDLTGYKFTDGQNDLASAQNNIDVLNGVIIGPGESIILSQIEQDTEPQQFIDWWGAANLPVNVQIRMYIGPGFGSGGDGVQLWDANDELVDAVTYGEATRGVTFTYNTNSGSFAVLSTIGDPGVFTAAVNGDIGSPGYTAGPVSLTILEHPTNLTISAGFDATFIASAQGLPKPRYQWFYNGNVLNDATSATLIITNAQTSDSGNYHVVVSNGLQSAVSSNAVLTVNPAASAPVFTVALPPALMPTIGQNITLTAQAVGFPTPQYQWRTNGVDLPGQTAGQLMLSDVQTNNSATYTVVAFNSAGTNSVSTILTVTPKPKLVVTEVQASEAIPVGEHRDWWELTNLDDHTINLRGYRFDDGSATITSAFTFTNDILIKPGESVVFVQEINSANFAVTPDVFRAWWGTNQLEGVQIVPYPDIGLGLSSGGDAINLWNPTATANSDTIASVTFSASPNPAGRTFVYDPDAPIAGILNVLATEGVNGAFVAEQSGDIGSPGRVVDPLIISAVRAGNDVDLTWPGAPGRNYSVEYKDDISSLEWTTFTNLTATGGTTTVFDSATPPQRYYRGRVTIVVP